MLVISIRLKDRQEVQFICAEIEFYLLDTFFYFLCKIHQECSKESILFYPPLSTHCYVLWFHQISICSPHTRGTTGKAFQLFTSKYNAKLELRMIISSDAGKPL